MSKLYTNILYSIKKGLYESLFDEVFDNDEDDIETDISDTMSDMLIDMPIQKISDMLLKNKLKDITRSESWGDAKYEKKIYHEMNGKCIAFYFNKYNSDKKRTEKDYIRSVIFTDKVETLNFIDLCSTLGGMYFMFGIYINFMDKKDHNVSNTIVDLKNVQFCGYTLKTFKPVNVLCDKDAVLNEVNKYDIEYDDYTPLYNFSVLLTQCEMSDSIIVKSADTVSVLQTLNVKDFSFINKIYNHISLNVYSDKEFPATYNFSGLPDGNYNVYLEVRNTGFSYGRTKLFSDDYIKAYESKPYIFNLVGVPETVGKLKVTIENPVFLRHFSFEGLTQTLLPKLDFNAHLASSIPKNMTILLGPFNFNPTRKNWSPTKDQFNVILSTKDWFLDCYEGTPTKTYEKPSYDNVESDNALKKALNKMNSIQLKKDDEIEDILLITKNIKKNIKDGDIFDSLNPDSEAKLYIGKVKENYITYKICLPYYFGTYNFIKLSYAEFINRILKCGNVFSLNGKDLILVLIDPVTRRRERVIKKRKEEEKLKRLEARLLAKQNKQVETEKTEEPIKKPEVKQKLQVVNNSNIKVIDYTDRSIAIYGDYKDMAPIIPLLKELGCKYNKFLTIDGKKTPGWIISNKYKDNVNKIING